MDALNATAVPTRIDRSILASKSGSNQKLLLSAVRYLNLADDQGTPTPDLQRLVAAEGRERQQLWRRILAKAYSELFDSGIDLERTTTQELSEIFERQGVTSADTIRKCVTFFSLAARDAGLKLSPHIKPYAGKRRPRVTMEPRSSPDFSVPSADTIRSESVSQNNLLTKFPNFDPAWPEEERNNWLSAFEKLLKMTHGSMNGTMDSSEHD